MRWERLLATLRAQADESTFQMVPADSALPRSISAGLQQSWPGGHAQGEQHIGLERVVRICFPWASRLLLRQVGRVLVAGHSMGGHGAPRSGSSRSRSMVWRAHLRTPSQHRSDREEVPLSAIAWFADWAPRRQQHPFVGIGEHRPHREQRKLRVHFRRLVALSAQGTVEAWGNARPWV